MSQPSCLPGDLILELSGENREKELVTIKTQKCLLGMDDSEDGKPQCVIFRGPKGATLRTYAEGILINDEPKTVHWLSEGDRITFPNATVIEVQQLGQMGEPESRTKSATETAVPSTSSVRPPCESTEESTETSDPASAADETSVDSANMNPPPVTLPQDQIDELVSEITALREKKKSTPGATVDLDRRLGELTSQLAKLVDLAANDQPPSSQRPSAPTVASRESAPTVAAPTETVTTTDPACQEEFEEVVATQPANQPVDSSSQFPPDDEVHTNPEVDLETPVASPESAAPAELVHEANLDSETQVKAAEQLELQVEPDPVPQPESKPEPAPKPRNESVSDILARMKSEGQWSGLPDDDDDLAPVPPAPSPEPEPITPPATNQREDADADVEDYMSQLLSRMRGGAAPAPMPAVKEPAIKKELDTAQQQPVGEPDIGLLKPEEFVPRRKAKRIESLNAMRELANSTARSAVNSSEIQRLRALAFVQLGIAVASLVMSGYYFGLCHSMGNVATLIGGACISVTCFLGFRFYMIMFQQIPFLENGALNQPLSDPAPRTRNRKVPVGTVDDINAEVSVEVGDE